jgi:hypothetical protein
LKGFAPIPIFKLVDNALAGSLLQSSSTNIIQVKFDALASALHMISSFFFFFFQNLGILIFEV